MIAPLPMISMHNVVREVEGNKQKLKRLLNDVTWSLQPGQRVAILSCDREEADSFLDCAAGVSPVQQGHVEIRGHISWPLGQRGALVGHLSARQNAAFLIRIYGSPGRDHEHMQAIEGLCDFEDDFFEQPIRNYNNAMRARFRLAISLTFQFDVYLVSRFDAWGFTSKSQRSQRFRAAFERLTAVSSLVVTHSDLAFQKEYCHLGLGLKDGQIAYEGDLEGCHTWLKNQKKRRKA